MYPPETGTDRKVKASRLPNPVVIRNHKWFIVRDRREHRTKDEPNRTNRSLSASFRDRNVGHGAYKCNSLTACDMRFSILDLHVFAQSDNYPHNINCTRKFYETIENLSPSCSVTVNANVYSVNTFLQNIALISGFLGSYTVCSLQ